MQNLIPRKKLAQPPTFLHAHATCTVEASVEKTTRRTVRHREVSFNTTLTLLQKNKKRKKKKKSNLKKIFSHVV